MTLTIPGSPVRLDPEFQALIAPLSEDERVQLEANISRDGCRDPLVTWAGEGVLLDGYNRFEICTRLGLPYEVEPVTIGDRTDARIWIRINQLGRRNLTDDQRAMLSAGLVDDLTAVSNRARATTAVAVREERAGRRPISEAAVSSKIAPMASRIRAATSKRARVSERKVRQAQALKKRSPELAEQVTTGEVTLIEAVRRTKPAVRAEQLAATVWPVGKFAVILADPPWKPDEGLLDPTRRIENQYPTLTLDELIALRPTIEALALADCVLLLWTTTQKIGEAVALIAAWNFVVKSGAVWIKPSVGMGYWFRGRHELLILATRGNPRTPLEADRPDSVITAPRRGHSEKPDALYALVERMFPEVPKVEIFARARRDGWSLATNESELRPA